MGLEEKLKNGIDRKSLIKSIVPAIVVGSLVGANSQELASRYIENPELISLQGAVMQASFAWPTFILSYLTFNKNRIPDNGKNRIIKSLKEVGSIFSTNKFISPIAGFGLYIGLNGTLLRKGYEPINSGLISGIVSGSINGSLLTAFSPYVNGLADLAKEKTYNLFKK